MFAIASKALYASHGMAVLRSDLLTIAWLTIGLSAIVLGASAFISMSTWVRLIRGTGYLWLMVSATVVLAGAAETMVRKLWEPAAGLTFTLVRTMLRPILSGLLVYPAQKVIGTARFLVFIAPQCSGLEGVALILAFTCLWLILFRRECRFPNALVLLPAGVVVMFLLNAVRIAVLIAIGNAGAARIALGGFHSQAGWIMFNGVALGFAFGARRIPWLLTNGTRPAITRHHSQTAAYLMPLIAALATGMATTAVSGSFNWFYGLNFFVVVFFLWKYRHVYRGLGWSATSAGPIAGVLAFAVWIGLDHWTHAGADTMPAALSNATLLVRNLWTAGRILTAVVAVPLAEELAFRGYLLRRLVASNFESVSLASFTWPALFGSSLLFGLMHGNQWFAATLAGLLYAAAMRHRGRIADAVLAHSLTNAMIAGYVVVYGKWHLW
jgi:exosortase E/protease (VPEID-CTERM system)